MAEELYWIFYLAPVVFIGMYLINLFWGDSES